MEDFYIHFDLEGNRHDIPVSQSIISEQTVLTIIQELNRQLFGGLLQIEVLSYPSEDGSHKKRFGILIGIGCFVLGSMFPDVTNGIIMGLGDGKKELKDYIKDGTVELVSLARGFLEKDNHDLMDYGVQPEKFHKAYRAKNQFYQSALSNQDTRGIGFDPTENFPVQRNQFVRKISDLPEDFSDVNPIDKYHKLIVISSINTEEEKDLAWQFKDEKLKRRFPAYMKDEAFYDFFLGESIYLKTLVVKVRYFFKKDENGVIGMGKKEVLNVYQYNDIEFCKFPYNATIEPAPLGINMIDIHDDDERESNVMRLF